MCFICSFCIIYISMFIFTSLSVFPSLSLTHTHRHVICISHDVLNVLDKLYTKREEEGSAKLRKEKERIKERMMTH